jgi:hypothetical protein
MAMVKRKISRKHSRLDKTDVAGGGSAMEK